MSATARHKHRIRREVVTAEWAKEWTKWLMLTLECGHKKSAYCPKQKHPRTTFCRDCERTANASTQFSSEAR